MKNKVSLISAIVLFLLISTIYYWEGFLGLWMMPLTLLLFFAFVALVISLLYQVYLLLEEKFSNRLRIVSTVLFVILLVLIIYQPVDPEAFEAKDVLIASREGVANCTTTYKLREDNSFVVRSVCFGIEKKEGIYSMSGDTIWFEGDSQQEKNSFKFAIIKAEENGDKNHPDTFTIYRSANDTIPLKLAIVWSDLKKSPS